MQMEQAWGGNWQLMPQEYEMVPARPSFAPFVLGMYENLG